MNVYLKKLFKAAIPLALTALILAGLLSSCGSEPSLKVPECIGLSQEDAEDALKDAGIEYSIEMVYSDTVDEGVVIDQNMEAGVTVTADQSIALIVSSGKKILYPDLVGKTKDKAEETLANLGLELAVGSEKFSDSVKKGCVISQDKKAGEQAQKGDKVTVVISKGPETVKVPDVTGKKLSDAKKALTNAKLKYKTKEEYSSSVAKGKVISQTDKGKNVKLNTVIVLTVSKGAKPEPTSSDNSDDNYDDSGGGSSDGGGSSSSSYVTPQPAPIEGGYDDPQTEEL